MLKVALAPNCAAEQRYILSVILDEFLGVPFTFVDEVNREPFVSLHGDGKSLTLPQTLLACNELDLLTPKSLPAQPLPQLSILRESLPTELFCGDNLPALYGVPDKDGHWINYHKDGVTLHLDVIGGSFFMLTRMEEVINSTRDEHQRFPASASLAYQENFLERPIVNEYLELLWILIRRLWPYLKRKERSFNIHVSHDVDLPYSYRPFRAGAWFKSVIYGLMARGSYPSAWSQFYNGGLARLGLPHHDPLDTFDWLMDKSEAVGIQSAFYFIAGGCSSYDAFYTLDDPHIRRLIRHIAKRGHEVGLHPSYDTFRDGQLLHTQALELYRLLENEQIEQAQIGGRQHYLRWEAPTTWQLWEDSGLSYDSTLSYASHAGFRCGVCYPYPVFNVATRQRLKLVERPLLIMEGTLLREDYMNLNHPQAREFILRIHQRVAKYQGTFELLWHNSWFAKGEEEKELYAWVLAACNTAQSKQ